MYVDLYRIFYSPVSFEYSIPQPKNTTVETLNGHKKYPSITMSQASPLPEATHPDRPWPGCWNCKRLPAGSSGNASFQKKTYKQWTHALSHLGVCSWTTKRFLKFQHVSALAFLGFRHCGATPKTWTLSILQSVQNQLEVRILGLQNGWIFNLTSTIQSYLVAEHWVLDGILHQLIEQKNNSFARNNYLHLVGFRTIFKAKLYMLVC